MNRKQYAMERRHLNQNRVPVWLNEHERFKKQQEELAAMHERERPMELRDIVTMLAYAKLNDGVVDTTNRDCNWHRECFDFISRIVRTKQFDVKDTPETWDELARMCVSEFRYLNSKLAKALK